MAIVEIKDQYYFYFDIGGDADFTDGGGSISSFVFEEFAGGSLPMFEFVFVTSRFEILPKINEGTVINCTFGIDSDHTEEMVMTIQKFEYTVQSAQFLRIMCRGFIGGTEHLSKCEIKGWKSKDSLAVIKDVAGLNYSVKSKATTPSDTQNWIRPNIPANAFIQQVWEHSYISDTNFLIYAINRRGEFVINDYKNATSGSEKWKLGEKSSAGSNSISIHPGYRINSNHGLLNNIAVYTKERVVYNIETGKHVLVSTAKSKPILASGSKLNVQSKDPKSTGKVMSTHEAHHSNYHKAYYNNKNKIALYGSTEVHVETDAKYLKFELYDLVKFNNIKQHDNEKDTEALTGLFLITRISRYWANKNFGTSLTLSKESLNGLKGALL